MDLNTAHHSLDVTPSPEATIADICLERYPRDLRRALTLAECGHVPQGHAVLVQGLLDARAAAHEPLQRIYTEALAVYETRYGVAVA